MTSSTSSKAKVWLVGAGPGDPDLISCRGRDVLESADVVLHDALSHPELLDYCPQAELVDVGKRYGERSPAQAAITEQILAFARQGKRIVRLKGGDPMMFARGGEEALALAEAGVAFEVVPGITSPVAASEFAGIPLTHRELSNSVTFITGSDRDGVDWSDESWRKLATATGTICVLMGMRRIESIAQAVVAGGRAAETPAAVVMWGARPEQRVVTGTLADIADKARQAGLSSPSIIIIGEVVSLRSQLNWYESLPLFGRRVLVARERSQARETVRSLRSRGAIPLVRPAISIDFAPHAEELDRMLPRLASFDWIVFTSANGVEAVLRALDRSARDARVFGTARLAAIGPRTAAALSKLGLRADLVADEYVAEGLVDKLLASGEPLGRVLLLRAEEARQVLPEALAAAASEVVVVPAYRTSPVEGAELAELVGALEGEVDVVLFTSSSMVDSVVKALGDRAPALLGRAHVACIGPVTAETARRHGLRVDLVSPTYTIDGTLDALGLELGRPPGPA